MRVRGAQWLLAAVLCSSMALPGAVLAQDAAEAPAPRPGDEEKARAHFRLGRAHYDNGNFAQAAVEMEEAYRISQRPALLYNIYLAYRDANDTVNAANALRNYLKLEKEVENRAQLESRLAALDRSIADGTASRPAAQPAAAQPQSTEAQPAAQSTEAQPAEQSAEAPEAATSATPAQKKSNLVPIVLMAGGGAMIAGGLVLDVMAAGKKSDAEAKCPGLDCTGKTLPVANEAKSLYDSGKSLALVGDILLFGGIAVAGTGAVLFILNQGGESEGDTATAPTALLACAPGTCFGAVRGAF